MKSRQANSSNRRDAPRLRHRVVLGVLAAVAAGTSPLTVQAVADLEPAPVDIQIAFPQPGEVVRNRVHMAPVRGAVRSGIGEPVDFDVVIALDTSHSTRFPSGIDIDEDSEVGFNPNNELIAPGSYPDDVVCSDPDDTILAAEVKAARYLVEVLSAGRTRVGVIAFSGDVDPKTGEIIDRRHPQRGMNVTGTVLVLPWGRGSSSASSVLAEAIRLGTAPCAIVLREPDDIILLGALVAEEMYDTTCPIVVVEPELYESITTGDEITVGEDGSVSVTSSQ